MKIKNDKVEASKEAKRIKVRLDGRTVITLKTMESFEQWKERYPGAKILSAA